MWLYPDAHFGLLAVSSSELIMHYTEYRCLTSYELTAKHHKTRWNFWNCPGINHSRFCYLTWKRHLESVQSTALIKFSCLLASEWTKHISRHCEFGNAIRVCKNPKSVNSMGEAELKGVHDFGTLYPSLYESIHFIFVFGLSLDQRIPLVCLIRGNLLFTASDSALTFVMSLIKKLLSHCHYMMGFDFLESQSLMSTGICSGGQTRSDACIISWEIGRHVLAGNCGLWSCLNCTIISIARITAITNYFSCYMIVSIDAIHTHCYEM